MCSFGILMPAIRPPKTVKAGDKRTMQIRARRRQDLDILRALYMQGELGESIHTPDKDYEYRAYCEPAAFAAAMYQMVMEIDYLKFKPTTDRFADDELHSAYNQIWSTVMRTLSSAKHRWEYWRNTGKQDARVVHYSTIRPKHELPTGDNDADGWTGRGVGYSDNGWPHENWTSGVYAPYRPASSTADRFSETEPDVLDEINKILEADHGIVPRETDDPVELAWSEIDALIGDLDKAVNHKLCDHAETVKADTKCAARYRKSIEDRISKLRAAILEYEMATSATQEIEVIDAKVTVS